MTDVAQYAYAMRSAGVRWFSPLTDFRLAEVPPRALWPAAIRTLLVLDWLRDHAHCPLVITSAYRTPKHNADIGGAEDSRHCLGDGFDVCSLGGRIRPLELARLVLKHPDANRLGVGAYADGHVHVDTRGCRARWGVPERWWEDIEGRGG